MAARALAAPPAVRRGAETLVGLIALQGALGYWQYFYGVPPALVVLHVLGAALVLTVAARTHLATTGRPQRRSTPPTPVHAAGTATAR